jgi:formylglycine-generating enzyme required for sulfatase activity
MKISSRKILVAVSLLVAVAAIAYARIPKGSQAQTDDSSMVKLDGGVYLRGCEDCKLKDVSPIHTVTLDAFWIDSTPVTNTQFTQFVEKTGYKTIAEITPKAEDFPGVPAEDLVAGSAVFAPPNKEVSLENALDWWTYRAGAYWRYPEGPGSNIDSRMDHPAVHIAYDDAAAYCKWAGKRLPTEAEYEYAARGGLVGKKYSWGDELQPEGRWLANIWQGKFPTANTKDDGFEGSSPVKAFAPNGYGLYDMSGNVWQWTSDWYRPDTYQTLVDTKSEIKNPTGPAESFDPNEVGVKKRVQRGGSFLCTAQYCTRYLAAARGKGEPSSSGSNVGFRCVK